MNKKGFMLAEVLIVSTLLIGTMGFMFIQINSITKAYAREFNYNTVDALYGAHVLKEYLDTKNYFFNVNTTKFIDKNEVNSSYFNTLVEELGVLKIIITYYSEDNNNEDIYEYLRNNYSNNTPYIGTDTSYYEKLIEFSTSLTYDNNYYYMVVAYEDGTFCDYRFRGEER